MKLYELNEAFRNLQDMLEQDESDYDQQTILDTLESLEFSIEEKIINIAKLVKSLEYDINAIQTEERRLQSRRSSLEERVKSLKRYAETGIDLIDGNKVKTPTISVWKQRNAPSLVIDDETKIESKYMVEQPPKIDRGLILEDLKDGIDIPWARLQQTESIRIR